MPRLPLPRRPPPGRNATLLALVIWSACSSSTRPRDDEPTHVAPRAAPVAVESTPGATQTDPPRAAEATAPAMPPGAASPTETPTTQAAGAAADAPAITDAPMKWSAE